MDNNLRNKILEKIKPNAKEHEKNNEIVSIFISELKKSAQLLGYDIDFFIGGSFGKNTYLKGSSDVDIFARFDKKYEDDKISFYLEQVLMKSKFNYKKQKGSRDYYSLEFKDRKSCLKIELVPNRKINNLKDMINSTDASPMHVEFLISKTKENPELLDEIRFAKQFFKSKQLYGAESYINGFSGHIIDILIAYYGSLEGLLISAKRWQETHFIDINNFYKDEKEALKKIDSSKQSCLIIVDPIFKERNAARALNTTNYSKFLVVAQNFDKLREQDFEIHKFDLMKTISGAKKFAKQNKLTAYFYVMKINITTESEDIAASKLLKVKNKLVSYFENYDFTVFKDDFFIDIKENVCLFILMFENTQISGLKKIKGPFVHMGDAVKNFIKNKEYYFIEENRVYSYDKRIFTKVDEINKFKVEDFEKMLGKKLDFVKSLKLMKN